MIKNVSNVDKKKRTCQLKVTAAEWASSFLGINNDQEVTMPKIWVKQLNLRRILSWITNVKSGRRASYWQAGLWQAGLWRAGLLLVLISCSEAPRPGEAVREKSFPPANISPGEHLFCITNLGHSLTVFDLENNIHLPEENRHILMDPVGPWFDDNSGYYLSRVGGKGEGKNLLQRFSPQTLLPEGQIGFPANSNPNQLLILPKTPTAFSEWGWVALRGDSHDNFATVGISVVNLERLEQESFHSLTDLVSAEKRNDEKLTSLLGFIWDADCPSFDGSCVYALVNNWNGEYRSGWLLVLQPDSQHRPQLKALVQLGISPPWPMLLHEQSLWIVRSGGFVNYGGQPGSLQQINTALLADADSSNDIIQEIALATTSDCPAKEDRLDRLGCDPTGISLAPQGDRAWVFTYDDDFIRVLDLSTGTLANDPHQLKLTGPLFSTQQGHFAALGGYGDAKLAKLSADGSSIQAKYDLEAGNGNLTCTPHAVTTIDTAQSPITAKQFAY